MLEPTPLPGAARSGAFLGPYLGLTWAALVLDLMRVLDQVELGGWTVAFALAVLLTYAATYLLVLAVPLLLLELALGRTLARTHPRASAGLLGALAVAGAGALQALVYVDVSVFRLFGYHLNGFVWNTLVTPGGIEAMGGGEQSARSVAAFLSLIVVGQALLLVPARALAPAWDRPRLRRLRRGGLVALLLLALGERAVFALSALHCHTPVLEAARAFPAYQPVTVGHLARRLGIEPPSDQDFRMRVRGALRYPRAPLTLAADRPRWNVVWLVSESLRADVLTPEVMPCTSAFASRAVWFQNHLSGGCGTRYGMFTMFYGLYGAYWERFLQARRGPLLIDRLLEDGYRFSVHTSARFSYPEFDKTLWSQVPPADLHEIAPDQREAGPAWQRDRAQVDHMLRQIDACPPDQPFFLFEFFESPHAGYSFPPDEPVIRPDYRPELDYARLRDVDEIQRDIGRIKNRYLNACHHLDAQIGRVLAHLEERGLLARTIVVITGDHGEEFLEHGRWGHNSAFTREQITPPLVLYIPGVAPAVRSDLTSHLDIPVTVLRALGVQSPVEEWSQGLDLLGPARRRFAVLTDWDSLAYATAHDRAVFMLTTSFRQPAVSRDDLPLPADQARAWLTEHRAEVLEITRGLGEFSTR